MTENNYFASRHMSVKLLQIDQILLVSKNLAIRK